MVKRYDLKPAVPREEWDKFLGLKLDTRSYDLLLDHDADLFDENGNVLLRFRKNCLDPGATRVAWEILRTIKQKSLNRGMATNKLYANIPAVRKGGYVSKTHEVPSKYAVNSNIVGYFDRYVRTPFCRQASWNAKHPIQWKQLLPFFQSAAGVFASCDPDRYASQMSRVAQTKPEWVISGTPFTTVTVNRNWQTAVHTDQGDLKEGLSLITAMEAGEYKGGYLVFPHYRVAVDLRNNDLMMFDSHHMHGNTAIIGKYKQWERISCVLYFREKMVDCGTAAEELERAKHRKKGDALYGD